MAHEKLLVAFSLLAAASPVSASLQGAPAAPPEALYCMRIEAITGSRLEKTVCWTRAEWAANDVDVDAEWAEEGVTVVGG